MFIDTCHIIILGSIFSTPASIFKLAGSPGMALMLWVIAGAISTSGAMVMLEFGSRIPRSGGIKVYLERSFSPKLLMTCIYLFYCVFLRTFLFSGLKFFTDMTMLTISRGISK